MSDQLKLSKLFYVNPRLLPIPITPPRLPIATTRARLTLLKNDIFTNGFDPNLPIIVRTTLHPTTLYKPKHPRFPSVTSILDIVWHTKYTGEAVNQMNASFDVNVDNFTQTSDVWFKDAEYEKMDGIASFTQEETEKYFNVLSMAGRVFRILNKKLLDGIKDDKYLNTQIKAFANFKIRQGMPIGNVNSHVVGLIKYLQNKLDKEVDKLKSVKGKENRRKKNEDILKFFTENKTALKNMFQMQNILIAAKMIVIKKLQDIQPLTKTFIQTDKGFEITNPEGFVAVTLDDGAVKLVDRLEFSRQNFLAPKTFGSR